MKKVTVTINTTVATNPPEASPPKIVTLIPYISGVDQNYQCANKPGPVMQRKHLREPLSISGMPESIDLNSLFQRPLNLRSRQHVHWSFLRQGFKGRMCQGLEDSGDSG